MTHAGSMTICSRASGALLTRQPEISPPAHAHDPAWGRRVRWSCPRFHAVVGILSNPFHAATYAFGRTVRRTTLVEGVPRRVHAPPPSGRVAAVDSRSS